MEADKMILGNSPKAVYSTDCSVTGVNNNVIVCAGTGGGKTMSITEPRLLTAYNSSLIVTCTKRRIVEKYKEVFKARGYNVLELNFANPKLSTVCYDPLAYISDNNDVKNLAEAIVMANPRKAGSTADPYWDDASMSLLCAMILLTIESIESPTFHEVIEIFKLLEIDGNDNNITTNFDEEFEKIQKKDPDHPAITYWKTFCTVTEKTARCIYTALASSLCSTLSPDIVDIISERKTVDFRKLADEKTILFITTSAVNPSTNCFVNLFYSQMFKQLFEYGESRPDGKLPRPVSVIADDFATGSRIQNFPEYISVIREKQISVTLLLQSETQLSEMYGYDDAATIINNCDTYVYLGGMDIYTCKNISIRANKPMEDILNMPVGEELIFRRGQKPLRTERYRILEDEEYKRITEAYETGINEQRNIQISTNTKLENEMELEEETEEEEDSFTAAVPDYSSSYGPVITHEFYDYMNKRMDELMDIESRLSKTDEKTRKFFMNERSYCYAAITDFVNDNIGKPFYTAVKELAEKKKRLSDECHLDESDKDKLHEFSNAFSGLLSVRYVEAYLSEYTKTIFINEEYDKIIYDYCVIDKDLFPKKIIKGFETIQKKTVETWLIREIISMKKKCMLLNNDINIYGESYIKKEIRMYRKKLRSLKIYTNTDSLSFLSMAI